MSLLVCQASLQLDMLLFLHRAAWELVSITGIQCSVLLLFLGIFKPATFIAMFQRIGLNY